MRELTAQVSRLEGGSHPDPSHTPTAAAATTTTTTTPGTCASSASIAEEIDSTGHAGSTNVATAAVAELVSHPWHSKLKAAEKLALAHLYMQLEAFEDAKLLYCSVITTLIMKAVNQTHIWQKKSTSYSTVKENSSLSSNSSRGIEVARKVPLKYAVKLRRVLLMLTEAGHALGGAFLETSDRCTARAVWTASAQLLRYAIAHEHEVMPDVDPPSPALHALCSAPLSTGAGEAPKVRKAHSGDFQSGDGEGSEDWFLNWEQLLAETELFKEVDKLKCYATVDVVLHPSPAGLSLPRGDSAHPMLENRSERITNAAAAEVSQKTISSDGVAPDSGLDQTTTKLAVRAQIVPRSPHHHQLQQQQHPQAQLQSHPEGVDNGDTGAGASGLDLDIVCKSALHRGIDFEVTASSNACWDAIPSNAQCQRLELSRQAVLLPHFCSVGPACPGDPTSDRIYAGALSSQRVFVTAPQAPLLSAAECRFVIDAAEQHAAAAATTSASTAATTATTATLTATTATTITTAANAANAAKSAAATSYNMIKTTSPEAACGPRAHEVTSADAATTSTNIIAAGAAHVSTHASNRKRSSSSSKNTSDNNDIKNNKGNSSSATSSSSGWTTSRHYAVPTTDLPVHVIRSGDISIVSNSQGAPYGSDDSGIPGMVDRAGSRVLLRWFNSLFSSRLAPLLAKQYEGK